MIPLMTTGAGETRLPLFDRDLKEHQRMAQPARPRNVRYRTFDRLRHASSNLKQFLQAMGTKFMGTAATPTFTADASTDVCTLNSHGFVTGKGPVLVANSGGALPGGLAASTWYWPIRIDANTFKLATSRAKATYGTAIDLTTNGTGTNTIRYAANAEAVMERLRQGVPYERVVAESDIDNL